MSTHFTRSALRLLLACAIVLVPPMSVFVRPARAEDPPQIVQTYGSIVSIRGKILQIRPLLRHKMERVAISDKTIMTGFESVTRAFLKPGMRVYVQCEYSETTGLHPNVIYAAEKPFDILVNKSKGLMFNTEHQRAQCIADLKSVAPFVITDGDGKDFSGTLDHLHGVVHVFQRSPNALMIGATISATGMRASDGVILATSIYPGDDFTKPGTLFGKILTVHGKSLVIQPRYTPDSVTVTLTTGCIVQNQAEIDADSVKIGDHVTFWVKYSEEHRGVTQTDAPLAVALIVGKERYPSLLVDSKSSALLSGKLVSLDPVQILDGGGKRVTVIIPAQMPIAKVLGIGMKNLKPGQEALFLLTPGIGGGYSAQAVIVNAAPWLGYGT